MIKVLIVDDSITESAILKSIVESEHDMEVIGFAKNGKEAVSLTAKLKPDLITMDIHMPVMDGFEAMNLILRENPTPIVVISSKISEDILNMSFKALEAGALSVLEKPKNISSAEFEQSRKQIVETIRSMAGIKVFKRRYNTQSISSTPQTEVVKELKKTAKLPHFEILAIGTSVGGPQVLKKILIELPHDFPIPIVIVQHMTQGFITGFTKWLNDSTPLNVKEATKGEILEKATVYFAPDNFHFEIDREYGNLIAKLIKSPAVSGFCPSATVLLKSVAKTCGKNAIGMLLTGMGNDGALGLLDIKKMHGHTLIQDPKSTVVFGMGGVAQSLGAVDKVLELNDIANYLTNITKNIGTR